jgi:integrase
MPSRPKPFAIGDVRVRAVRGPHRSNPDLWYFRAELYQAGDSRTVWTGWSTKDDATKAVAKLVANDEHLEDEAEEDDQADDDTPPETVKELLQDWLEHIDERDDLRPKSRTVYRNRARRLSKVIGSVALASFDAEVVQLYLKRTKGQYADRTRYSDVGSLQAAWKWARHQTWGTGYRPILPARRPRDIGNVRNRYTPTEEEVGKLLAALQTRYDAGRTRWRFVAVTLLYATGARLSEVLTLSWDRVDLDAGVVELHGKMGARRVPVPNVLDLLRRERARKPRALRVLSDVAVQSGKSIIGLEMQKECARVGVPPFTPTALRRMMSDRLIDAGVNIKVYVAFMGHSPATALRHYARARGSDIDTMARELGLGVPKRQVLQFPARDQSAD